MLLKVFFVLAASIALAECAKLRKTPKVYNAIITTDENLTPSRAFPLIQPVIQPAIPVLSPFYPAGFYDPYSVNDVNSGRREFKNEKPVERKADEPEATEESVNTEQALVEEPQNAPQPSNVPEEKPEGEKSPIPLNEYGFPPSLIPLQKYPTYPFSYPFIYDSYGNFQAVQQFPVLPPSYFPQQEHQLPPIEQPMFHVGRKFDRDTVREDKSMPANDNSLPTVSNDAFKNNGNRNIDIPDAEIPPIPFTIKNN